MKLIAAAALAAMLLISPSCGWFSGQTATVTTTITAAPSTSTGTHIVATAMPSLSYIQPQAGPVEMRRGSALIAAEAAGKVWHSPEFPGLAHISLTLLSFPMTQGQAPADATNAPSVVVTTFIDLPANGGTKSHSFAPVNTTGAHALDFEADSFDVRVSGYGNAQVVVGYTAMYPAGG